MAETFIELVAAMRAAQNAYFRHRSHENLERAKELEREVDAWIDAETTKQRQLFDGGKR